MKLINELDKLEKTIQESDLCLVKIGTTCCAPCKLVQKNIEDIERHHPDVSFIEVDAEEADDIVDKYNIRGVPVVIVFRNGEEVSRTVGVQSQAQLEDRLIN